MINRTLSSISQFVPTRWLVYDPIVYFNPCHDVKEKSFKTNKHLETGYSLLVEVLEIFRLFVDGGFEVQVIAVISLCTIVAVQLKGAVIQLKKRTKHTEIE